MPTAGGCSSFRQHNSCTCIRTRTSMCTCTCTHVQVHVRHRSLTGPATCIGNAFTGHSRCLRVPYSTVLVLEYTSGTCLLRLKATRLLSTNGPLPLVIPCGRAFVPRCNRKNSYQPSRDQDPFLLNFPRLECNDGRIPTSYLTVPC